MKYVLLAAPMLIGAVLFAQGPGARRNFNGAAGTPPTPAQIAQRETNRLTRFFSLTSTQQSTVLGILTTADTQVAALQTQIQPLRAALPAAIKANNPAQINSTLQQISPLQQQMESIRAVAAGQIYATVLTASQQGQVANGLGPLLGQGGGFRRGRR
jgi:hypothetical protein